MRRTIQVLGIALMVAGLFIDSSARSRRRAGATTDRDLTSRRLPLLLFWIGAVVLVLASI
jgi:heme/copper-type cytochrome/quinol oxidase subunit 2